MLYTRKGDLGTSELLGANIRLPKNSLTFEALGTIDELNSLLGFCRAKYMGMQRDVDIYEVLLQVQECLFVIQAELAGAKKFVTEIQINEMESVIARLEKIIIKPESFVIPGETERSAMFDYARAVARRAERSVCAVTQDISPATLAYLNRLSSLLYALARYSANLSGVNELSPTY